MRFLLIILTVSLTTADAIPGNSHRIVGGQLASISQYPEIASLLYSWLGTTYSQSCGGTILTTRSILTAAHCPHGDAVYKWRVRVGSSYANSGGTVHTLNSVIIHPSYNSRINDYDVAILRTDTAIIYGTFVQQGSIAGSNYYLADNQAVWAAGWGTTSFGGTGSEQLRHVQIWTINQETCKARYAILGYIVTDNMLCSGWLDVGGRDQCQGDSGGPLYHVNNGRTLYSDNSDDPMDHDNSDSPLFRNNSGYPPYQSTRVVVGICSWGLQCALPTYPGVNTRVSRFTPWIQANA